MTERQYYCELRLCTSPGPYADSNALIEHIDEEHVFQPSKGEPCHCKWEDCRCKSAISGKTHRTRISMCRRPLGYKPLVHSQAAAHAHDKPLVYSQAAVHARDKPLVYSQAAVHARDKPLVYSEAGCGATFSTSHSMNAHISTRHAPAAKSPSKSLASKRRRAGSGGGGQEAPVANRWRRPADGNEVARKSVGDTANSTREDTYATSSDESVGERTSLQLRQRVQAAEENIKRMQTQIDALLHESASSPSNVQQGSLGAQGHWVNRRQADTRGATRPHFTLARHPTLRPGK